MTAKNRPEPNIGVESALPIINHIQQLDPDGAEPLEGSGVENETPETDFEEEQ